MFSPHLVSRRKYCCCPDLNLIPSTFLKATFAMSAPPYLIDLTYIGENKVTLLDLVTCENWYVHRNGKVYVFSMFLIL